MNFATKAAWLNAAEDLTAALAALDRQGPDGGRRLAIFLLWRHIALAPTVVRHAYSFHTEARIRAAATSAAEGLNLPAFGLQIGPKSKEADVLLRVGGLLRALEMSLSEEDVGARPADPNVDWRLEWSGEGVFLVPLARGAWREAKPAETDNRPFDQRGLTRVRIIPTYVDGAAVRLYQPDRLGRAQDEMRFGAVLFPQLEFSEERGESTFRIVDVQAPEMDATLAFVCEAAHAERCLGVVMAELTINDNSLQRIVDLLADKPWLNGDEGPLNTPAIVMAGSWHVPREERFANVAPVLDGDGELILAHQKRFPFVDHDGCAEDIDPGDELPVLVLDEGLFTFGICLDFCHRAVKTPYGELDVDFVLVPSCGNAATMEGHIQTATDLDIARKTRTFVVQQAYPPIDAGLGYVLPPDGRPGKKRSDDLVQAQSWSIFHAAAFRKALTF